LYKIPENILPGRCFNRFDHRSSGSGGTTVAWVVIAWNSSNTSEEKESKEEDVGDVSEHAERRKRAYAKEPKASLRLSFVLRGMPSSFLMKNLKFTSDTTILGRNVAIYSLSIISAPPRDH
jgi:hypothetical protein